MCLYPKLIKNRKYVANKKNGGDVPIPTDYRALYVPIGCQKCMECRKQKGRNWKLRLLEEVRTDKTGNFVTLTFSNESLKELIREVNNQEVQLEGYELDNEICTLAVRRFLERWRKKYGKSVKHWLITELGHNGTENVHIHGIVFTKEKEDIKKIWGYGYVFIGDYVNEATVNYCIKYATKMDLKNQEYMAKVLTSPGIGKGYTLRPDSKRNRFKDRQTIEYYKTREGYKIAMPTYWRNKIYTEEEREKLWLYRLDKNERWVDGTRVDVSKTDVTYYKLLEEARQKNARLGYGNDEKNWERIRYENERRRLKIQERLKKLAELENIDEP